MPTELRKLTGNRSKKPLPKNEPKPDLGAAPPSPPEWLDEVAVGEWNRLARQLWLNGILGLEDWTAFAGYCESFSDWMRYNGMLVAQERQAKAAAEAALAFDASSALLPEFAGRIVGTSNGNLIQAPLVGLRNAARRDCLKFAAEFGLSPSSRSRVSVPRGAGGVALPKADAQTARKDKPRPVDFLNRGPRSDNVVPLKA